jgi:hypothetical protein
MRTAGSVNVYFQFEDARFSAMKQGLFYRSIETKVIDLGSTFSSPTTSLRIPQGPRFEPSMDR